MPKYVYVSSTALERGPDGQLVVTEETRYNNRGELGPTDDFPSFSSMIDRRQNLHAVLVDKHLGDRGVPPVVLGVPFIADGQLEA